MTNTKAEPPPSKYMSLFKALVHSSFAVAVFCFVLVNVSTGQILSSAGTKLDPDKSVLELLKTAKNRTFSWWTTRAYEDEPGAPDIALIGSSQMASATFAADAQLKQHAMDVLKHRRASTLEEALKDTLGRDYSVFNCSQGGFMVSDGYMLSRALFQGQRKPKVVIIGVSPRDFIDNSLNAASATEPFQFYAPCVNLHEMGGKAFPDPIAHLGWVMSKDLPLRRLLTPSGNQPEQAEVEAKPLDKHLAQNQMAQALSDIAGDLKPGVLLIPANIPIGLIDNTSEYEHRYRNPYPPVYSSEQAFFNEQLAFLQDSGIKVIVVGMPNLWPTREIIPDKFWVEFKQKVASACQQHGARWIDYCDANGFETEDFLDTVHLNAQGGARLFKLIAQAVASDQAVVASLSQPRAEPESVAATSSTVAH
jgi:hypothetical protein